MIKIALLSLVGVYGYAGIQSLEVAQSNKQKVFEVMVQQDGYINIDKQPARCGTVYLLDGQNKLISNSMANYGSINQAVKRGKYTIQIIPTNADCSINIVY
ncbi:MAG: hypothetical protein AB7S65_10050 [Sulfuricurvum sp.]